MDRSKESVSDPIGFRAPNAKVEETAPRKSNIEDLKMKRANEAANRPFQALFMTMLMLFMSGGGLNIFSIMITCGAMWTPINNLINTNATFAPFKIKGKSLAGPKLKYVGINFIGLLMGVYKFSYMGLIPVSAEDWIGLIDYAHPTEMVVGFVTS